MELAVISGLIASCASGLAWLLLTSDRLLGRVSNSSSVVKSNRTRHRAVPRRTWLLAQFSHLAEMGELRHWLRMLGPSDARLGEMISAAGAGAYLSVRELRGLQAAGLAVGTLLGLRIALGQHGVLRVVTLVGCAWAGAAMPKWWLARRRKHRTQAMRRVLPDALELLRACIAAGMPVRRALAAVSDHCPEPAASEFAIVAAEAAFGTPLQTALEHFAARNPLPEVRALVTALSRAQRHGSPLEDTMRQLAHDARRALDTHTAERAAAAAPQIQLVVSALLVPAALLELAAMVIAALARGDLHIL